jgi:hypothetical protein
VTPEIQQEETESLSFGSRGLLEGKIPYGRHKGFHFDKRIVAQEHLFTASMVIYLTIKKNSRR